jgi:leucyl aminopeptidase
MNTTIDCFCDADEASITLTPLTQAQLPEWLKNAPPRQATWVKANGFQACSGQLCPLPNSAGDITQVLIGSAAEWDPEVLGGLAERLAPGCYALDCDWSESQQNSAITAFALGAYRYSRYRQQCPSKVKIQLPSGSAGEHIMACVEAIYLGRDLINTPAEDLPPQALAQAAQNLGDQHGARCTHITGDDLLDKNYPAIHAVGRASIHPPRLVDLRWGDGKSPRVTLVGKGVCFDSGGLDLKSAAGMRIMKKDMGGAAHVLCLASMIMEAKLPIQLRVLIPAVENSVSANSFRPGDVIPSRQGLFIEIDNTDAEGRLVLADALTEACSEDPDLVLDFATLTGAARVAVGTEIAALFCNDEALAKGLQEASTAMSDPIWRMPLHRPYRKMIESKIANLVNSAASSYAGAITAALFLEHFVTPQTAWAHFDIMAWNTSPRPGHPEGGEMMGVRAVFDYLQKRYS